MHKLMEVALVLLILFSFAAPASADTAVVRGIQPEQSTLRYTYIAQLIARLTIDGSGLATSSGSVLLTNSSHRVELTVALQQSTTNGWVDVASWSRFGPGIPALSIEEDRYVLAGTYRVSTTARVFTSGGTLLEVASGFSSYMVYK